MGRPSRIAIVYLVIAVLGVLALQDAWQQATAAKPLAYSEFADLLRKKKVRDLVITNEEIRGELIEPIDGKSQFVTIRVEPELADELDKSGVKYGQMKERESIWPIVMSWFLPMLFFLGLWFFVIRRMAERGGGPGGLMAIGRSKAKVYVEKDTRVTFADVAGVDEAKEELQEVVSFLKDPQSHSRLGARIPKGVLLVGPPGTGKTLLARAVAGEAGVSFFSISGSEFVEMFVGVGAARVRDLFEQARQKAPAIIFIDELDALGRARNAPGFMGGHDEKEQTLNQLLVELDGFDPSSGIVLLAATNRPEILDPALLRAGRFDRQVLVDKPDRRGRCQILQVHMKKVQLASDVEVEQIAQLTPGFTGADLANLVNEAALLATRRKADAVGMQDFTSAIERIVAGLEKKSRILNPREREVIAHHEMGHALVASLTPGSDPVHKISIIPRGVGALGYTIQRPTDDRYLMTRKELESKMAVLMAGRAAEHIVYAHLSTGASDDLAKATDIARSMVTRFGMAPELGNVTYESAHSSMLGPAPSMPHMREYSDETAHTIDIAVRKLVDGAFDRAVALLKEHRALLDEGAKRLLEEETLDETAVRRLLEPVRPDLAAQAVALDVAKDRA